MAVAVQSDGRGGVPPHNEEAEASVLGAILLTEQALDGILLEVGLRPEDRPEVLDPLAFIDLAAALARRGYPRGQGANT